MGYIDGSSIISKLNQYNLEGERLTSRANISEYVDMYINKMVAINYIKGDGIYCSFLHDSLKILLKDNTIVSAYNSDRKLYEETKNWVEEVPKHGLTFVGHLEDTSAARTVGGSLYY